MTHLTRQLELSSPKLRFFIVALAVGTLLASDPSNSEAQNNVALAKSIQSQIDSSGRSPREVTLEVLLESVDQASPEILLAKAQVERQAGVLKAARSNFLPNLGVVGTTSFGEGSSSEDRFRSSRSWDAKLELEQKLYLGGRNRAIYSKSKSLLRAAKHRTSTARNHLKFKVKEAFYRLLLVREQFTHKDELKSLLQIELKKESLRYKNGISPAVNKLRVELDLEKLKAEQVRLRQEEQDLISYILQLSAHDGKEGIELIGLLPTELPNISHTVLEEAAQTNRSEHLRFRELARAAEFETKASRAFSRPELSFFANYGLENGVEGASEGDGWRAGLRAKWKIFDGFENDGIVETAKAEEKIRQLQYSNFKLSLNRDISQTLTLLEEARALLSNTEPQLKKARENLRLLKLRYQAGQAKQIEFLEASNTLKEAAWAYTDSKFKAAIALALVEKVTQTKIINLL